MRRKLPDSYRKDCRANAIRMLEACETLSCPIILSSDSHGREHIGDAAMALALAEEVRFPKELINS